MNGWFLWDQLVDKYTITSWILEDIPFLSTQPQNRTSLFGTPKNCRESLNHWVLELELAMRFALQVVSLVSSEGFPDHSWEFLARNMDQWSKVCIYSENFEKLISTWWHRWWKESGVYQLRLVVYLIIHIVFIHPRYIPDGAEFLPCLSMLHVTSLKNKGCFKPLWYFMMDKISISWIYPWPRMPVQKSRVFPRFFRSLVVTDDSILGGVDPTQAIGTLPRNLPR